MNQQKIKVLVVDDSSAMRMLFTRLLGSDPQVQMIGSVNCGQKAMQFIARKSPDVILMNIDIPETDGFETTRRIMETRPVPIVIYGGADNPRETTTAFRLMEAGAVACLDKPIGAEHQNFHSTAAELLLMVKLMSEVKVVRRWASARRGLACGAELLLPTPRLPNTVKLIGIGASTGGPPVLQTILAGLPKDFPAPLLIVQHIARGFLAGLVQWLDQTTGCKVHIAAYGMQPLAGHVYLAPDGFHMAVGAGGKLVLNKTDPDYGLRPSVAHLFRSLAEVCGASAVGVLLTGMGKDGALELNQMKQRGAFTIAQDRETSIVHGMPGEAIALGAATCVLPADGIAPALVALVNQHPSPRGPSYEYCATNA